MKATDAGTQSDSDSGLDNPEDVHEFLAYMIEQSRRRLDAFKKQFGQFGYDDDFDQPTGNELPLPSWFPNPQVYRGLIKTYHDVFQDLKKAKSNISRAIRQLKKPVSNGNAEKERIIESLKQRQAQLTTRKQELLKRKAANDQRREMSGVQQANKQNELNELQQRIMALEKEREVHQEWLNKCMEENDELLKDNEQIGRALKRSTMEIAKLQTKLSQSQAETQEFIQRRNENQKKNEALTQQMKNLESEKVEAEYKIKHLQEQLQDHDKMLAAFDLANKQLARERAIEASAISKMKEAVNSAEELNEEAKRLKREASSIRDEVNRAKQTLSETLVKLKADAKRKVDSINANYEARITEADKQFTQLLNDNAQLSASIETMRRQLSFLESQNGVLRSDDGRGRSSFEEFTRGAKSQLEMLNSQLEELTRESQRLREEEQRQKTKLANAESDCERSNSGARKNVDKLEADLAQVKANMNEAEAQGKALLAENERLNSELTRVNVECKRDVEVRVAEKENEIRLLQGRLDEMRRNHIAQTGELQRVLLENKRHADKWREAAENFAVESEQGLEEAEQKTQQYAQKAAAYQAEIERQEAEAASLQQVIAKRQQEARDLQSEYEQIEHRLFDQKTQLDALYEQQLQFANKRELTQNEIDKKKTEYKRLKREYAARVRYESESRKKQ